MEGAAWKEMQGRRCKEGEVRGGATPSGDTRPEAAPTDQSRRAAGSQRGAPRLGGRCPSGLHHAASAPALEFHRNTFSAPHAEVCG